MKAKAKCAVLLLALGIMFAGCFESPGSVDENAAAAKDNPVLGTWLVTIDPQNNKMETSRLRQCRQPAMPANRASRSGVRDWATPSI
jgi:hypothetical protein